MGWVSRFTMPRDLQLLRRLREVTREAALDLDNLKLIKPDRNPEVARLRRELNLFLLAQYWRVVKEARTALSQAKASSRRHRLELAERKKVAEDAEDHVFDWLRRLGLEPSTVSNKWKNGAVVLMKKR